MDNRVNYFFLEKYQNKGKKTYENISNECMKIYFSTFNLWTYLGMKNVWHQEHLLCLLSLHKHVSIYTYTDRNQHLIRKTHSQIKSEQCTRSKLPLLFPWLLWGFPGSEKYIKQSSYFIHYNILLVNQREPRRHFHNSPNCSEQLRLTDIPCPYKMLCLKNLSTVPPTPRASLSQGNPG